MNFYLSALDELIRHSDENPSIGIILCRQKNNTIVEFAFRDMKKPMGVATYRCDKKLPESLQRFLPKPEEFDELFNV